MNEELSQGPIENTPAVSKDDVSPGSKSGERISLDELLGEDWKERSIFPDLASAIPEFHFDDLDLNPPYLKEIGESKIKAFVNNANIFFRDNNRNLVCQECEDRNHEEHVLIVSKIGRDKLYMFAKYPRIVRDISRKTVISFLPERVGIQSENGIVFSLDGLISRNEKKQEFAVINFKDNNDRFDWFFENFSVESVKQGQKTRYVINGEIPDGNLKLLCLFHEIGHMFIDVAYEDLPIDEDIFKAKQTFRHLNESKNDSPETITKLENSTKLVSNNERRAWAVGLSILKEACNITGLQCLSKEKISEASKLVDEALANYEEFQPLADHSQAIPMTQESRGEARRAGKYDKL